jgi:hypothetical protein
MEYIEPVYPKPNPEYRQQVLNELYKKVRNTNWGAEDEGCGKPRGRKAKVVTRPESVPRTEGERKAKQQGYNWFDKWTK